MGGSDGGMVSALDYILDTKNKIAEIYTHGNLAMILDYKAREATIQGERIPFGELEVKLPRFFSFRYHNFMTSLRLALQ